MSGHRDVELISNVVSHVISGVVSGVVLSVALSATLDVSVIPHLAHAQESGEGFIEEESAEGLSEEERERARETYQALCARCHGRRGDGRGPLASHLSPRPTDLTRADWLKRTSAEQIERVILGGGGRLGKSILMPANPQLRAQPRLLATLIEYVMDFVPKAPPPSSEPAQAAPEEKPEDSSKGSSKRSSKRSSRGASERASEGVKRASRPKRSSRPKRPKRPKRLKPRAPTRMQ